MATICIKIGGSTVDSGGLLQELGAGLKRLINEGHFPVLIHGGGKDIAKNLNRLNKEFTFIEGHRVTDKEILDVVQMVLSGDVNKRIVNALLVSGISAIGISGVDGNLFNAEKLLINGLDIGFVGTIKQVNTALMTVFSMNGLVPVISPISRDNEGIIYNINADLAAGELAIALNADHCIYISDVSGVKIGGLVKREIMTTDIEPFIAQGHITGGMIPKVRSAREAVSRGVGRVHIVDWYGANTLSNELDVETSHGTVIY